MYRFIVAIFLGFMIAPSVKSQVALEQLVVNGQTISYGNSVLCAGVTCMGYFSQSGEFYPFDINLLTITRDDSDEAAPNKIPGVLKCTGDREIREDQAWLLYKAVMMARYVNKPIALQIADGRNRVDQAVFEFQYSDGSHATYYRSNTEFTSTVGMIEVVLPACR
jgi:hypothetical protein